jgi:segregation and condensation protein A
VIGRRSGLIYKVRLDVFEGPLDLLLHLINRLEIDIYDIPMSELTEQYMEHIQAMRVLRLDELSEYLVLAATLIEIKSKMLLPIHEGEDFGDDADFEMEEDPRDELVARLIEYRKYKEAATSLKEAADNRLDFFTKSPGDLSQFGEIVSVGLEESLNVFDLIGAFQKMIDRNRLRAPLSASITKTELSVGEKMDEIMGRLVVNGGRCDFHTLFEEGDTGELVVTFMSILELMLRGDVNVEQSNNFANLIVSYVKDGEESHA